MDSQDNVLMKFAKVPYADYKKGTVTRDEGVIEEVLGRLGSLRRNQWIVEVGAIALDSLKNEHDMMSLNIVDHAILEDIMHRHAVPKDPAVIRFATNAYTLWNACKIVRPLIVAAAIDPKVPPGPTGNETFTTMVHLGHSKGYTPICHADTLMFVRDDQVKRLDIPTVFLRDPEKLFEYSSL